MRPFERDPNMPNKTPLIVGGAVAVLLGTGAWLVDLSMSLQTRSQLKAAAEAAALAAAYNLLPPIDEATVKSTAVTWVGRNGHRLSSDDVGLWDRQDGRKAVTVRLAQVRPTLLGARQETIEASATLGGLPEVPAGALPLAVPAYQDEQHGWWGLASATAGDYRLLTTRGLDGGPTRLMMRLPGPGEAGSCLPLALAGADPAAFRRAIVQGWPEPLPIKHTAGVLEGELEEATIEALKERLQASGKAQVILPLVRREAWEQTPRPRHVAIAGYAFARIEAVTDSGTIYAHYIETVLPGPGVLASHVGAGGYAPVLIDTPTDWRK